jgi:GxxExxY protein
VRVEAFIREMSGEMKLIGEEMTDRVLGAAVEVHRCLGPGLLESTYRLCLIHQMTLCGLPVQQEVSIPIMFKGYEIANAYRADLIVNSQVLIELKATESILPIHVAQTLTYLRHSNLPIALLLNFNVPKFQQGIRRFVHPHARALI